MPPPVQRRPSARVDVRRPDPDVWRRALRLAGGDPRRIDVLTDGSVVVRNQPVR